MIGYCGEQVVDCKCKAAIVLKKKKDKNSFYMSCRGYPNCKVSIWFPDAVINATVSEQNCEKVSQLRAVDILYFSYPEN